MKKEVYFKSDDEHSMAQSFHVRGGAAIRLKRFLLILGYIAYVALWILAVGVFQTFVFYLMTFSLLSLCVLIFYTWRYTQPEYEISVNRGTFCLAVIWGGVQRKDLYTCRISEMSEIKPLREEPSEKTVYRILADSPDENTVVASCPRETAVIFEAGERMRYLLRYYNSQAFFLEKHN